MRLLAALAPIRRTHGVRRPPLRFPQDFPSFSVNEMKRVHHLPRILAKKFFLQPEPHEDTLPTGKRRAPGLVISILESSFS